MAVNVELRGEVLDLGQVISSFTGGSGCYTEPQDSINTQPHILLYIHRKNMVNGSLKYLCNTIVRLPNVISKTNQAQNAHAIHVKPVADLGGWVCRLQRLKHSRQSPIVPEPRILSI